MELIVSIGAVDGESYYKREVPIFEEVTHSGRAAVRFCWGTIADYKHAMRG